MDGRVSVFCWDVYLNLIEKKKKKNNLIERTFVTLPAMAEYWGYTQMLFV